MAAILFDFDFTLADSSFGIADAFNAALSELGHATVSLADVRPTIGLTLAHAFAVVTGVTDPDAAIAFHEAYRRRADETMNGLTMLYPGARETIETLRGSGARIGIVSTKSRYRIESLIDRFGLSTSVDIVVGYEDVTESKPDPAGLLLAMERLETTPDSTMYIGDHIVDAEAAHRAGIDFIGVLTGEPKPNGFGGFPSIGVVAGIADVPELVLPRLRSACPDGGGLSEKRSAARRG